MQVQVNHDNHLRIAGDTSERLSGLVADRLASHADRITRVEVHLGDTNAGKHGQNDKRCMLEARIAKMQPIAVTHSADSVLLAFDGALEKLEHAVGHALGKEAARRPPQPPAG